MRVYHSYNPLLWTPPTRQGHGGMLDEWPRCMRCNGPVEAYGVSDEGSKRIEIWARCHGKHECLRITWDHLFAVEPSWVELQREIGNLPFFKSELSEL